VDTNDAVRSVVVMNGSSLTRPPADDEHLDGFIATNAVAPVVAFLESEERLDIQRRNLDIRQPGIDLFERRWRGLGVQVLDQFGKSQRTGIWRRSRESCFRINRCRQMAAPGGSCNKLIFGQAVGSQEEVRIIRRSRTFVPVGPVSIRSPSCRKNV